MKNMHLKVVLRHLLVLAVLVLVPAQLPAAEKGVQQPVYSYSAPDVTLVTQNNARVNLKRLMETDKTIVLNFTFSSCTRVGPILSAGVADAQKRLGADAENVHFLTISIDPEYDTPKIMKAYLARFEAQKGWDFLTGSKEDIDSILKAFKVRMPNKMAPVALTLIRGSRHGNWVRLNGILSGSQFIEEIRKAKSI